MGASRLFRLGRQALTCTAVMATGIGLSLLAVEPASAAAGDLTVTVTSASTPVKRAFVSLTADGQQTYAGLTNADGEASFTGLPDATWNVATSKSGFGVARASVDTATDSTAATPLTASASKFATVPVFGAQGAAVAAGGPGEFYAMSSVIPQLFRSVDYGGSWTQVTLGYDDADDGLAASSSGGDLTTSGVPGEVAVVVGQHIYASKDFGVSWQRLTDTPNLGGGNGVKMWWGHQGPTSVLLARASGGGTFVADMADANPTFISKAYGSNSTDLISVAQGGKAPWVAVGSGSTVNLYPLTAVDEALPDPITATDGGPLTCVVVGGASTGNADDPPSLLFRATAYGPDPARVSVISWSSGTWQDVASAGNSTEATCDGQDANGRVEFVRSSDATAGRLHVGGFFASWDETTSSELKKADGPQGVYSAGYELAESDDTGSGRDNVFLHTQGDRGFAKSTAFKTGSDPDELAHVPYQVGVNSDFGYPIDVYDDATSGVARNSGGGSVNGITVAVVKDAAFHIGGSAGESTDKGSVMLSTSGGGQGLATTDGGVTLSPVVNKGGSATAMWEGAGGKEWLVYGHSNDSGVAYTVVRDWAADQPVRSNGPGQTSTIPTDPDLVSDVENGAASGLAGVPGTDLMLGTTSPANGDPGTDKGGVFRAELSGVNASETGNVATSHAFAKSVNGLAYCPSTSGSAALQDVALLAMGNNDEDGMLRVVSTASTNPDLTGAEISIPQAVGFGKFEDIDVNCHSGVIAIAARNGLLVSQDSGASWIKGALPTGGGDVTAVGVEKSALNSYETRVAVARGAEGFTYLSGDGGSTFSTANDPQSESGRNFSSEGIKVIRYPGATTTVAAAARAQRLVSTKVLGVRAFGSNKPLVASGSGAANLTASVTLGSKPVTPPVTPPAKASQAVAGSVVKTLKKKKSAALPAKTNRGKAISWRSATARVCKVGGGKVIAGKKVGKCTLVASSPATATLKALAATYRITVK